jgi:uncharacterized protein (DUF1800 family)
MATGKNPSRLLALCAAVMALVGCGGGGGGGATTTDTTATASSPGSATATAAASSDETTAQAAAEAAAADAAKAAAATVAAEAAAGTAQQAEAQTVIQASAAVPLENQGKLIIRARGTPAGGIAPVLQVRLNGGVLAELSIGNIAFVDHVVAAPGLKAGAAVDLVYTNDASVGGVDRNLFIAYLAGNGTVLLPNATGTTYDRGAGNLALDGLDLVPAQGAMYWGGALRFVWPAQTAQDTAARSAQLRAFRLLQHASFGPEATSLERVVSIGAAAWLNEQIALPHQPDFVNHIDAKFALGDSYRPKGTNYTTNWLAQKFWSNVLNSPDQLRKRVAYALQQIWVVSLADSNQYYQARAYANYLDTLNQHAFGNYRQLMEAVALSPSMGIYLSHMRNRPEDAASARMPDENFARELMQLFSIGLVELNLDGSPKLDANGKPQETYSNADVMALAKVFTGFSWALPDAQLTANNFRWATPDITKAANDQRLDLLPMKAYPGQHSTVEKKLFSGKAWATTLPAGNSAQADVKAALDTLFNHPNVGPFIGRQLIQRLVSSHPSPAYVARVAAVFNNNGQGVRGDMAAVVKAILLDSEARNDDSTSTAKLREPVLRVAHWMRALGAQSATGEFTMAWELETSGQRALNSPSVFNHYRPGYIPPGTAMAVQRATTPEFQIANESTVAAWVNSAEAMAGTGLGWNGTRNDVYVDYAALGQLVAGGQVDKLINHLDRVLLGGRMNSALRQAILDALTGIPSDANTATNAARAATFLVLASPAYITQQ